MSASYRDKKVFISYRRDDEKTEGVAHAIYNKLVDKYKLNSKDIFLDHNSIRLGENFAKSITDSIDQVDIVFVLIGKKYTSLQKKDATIPRIKEAKDYVRLEVAESLRQQKLIIPILVNGASMPSAEELPSDLQDLRMRNAFALRSQTLNEDIHLLAKRAGILMWRYPMANYLVYALVAFIIVYFLLSFLEG